MAKLKKSNRKRGTEQGGNIYARIWASRAFVLVLALVVVGLGVSLARELVRKVEMSYEIATMESEVERLTRRNTEIQDVIALLNTSSMQEKEARVKLGMQQHGERVVMLPGAQEETEIILPDSDKIRYIPIRDYQSNPEKWFHYFWNHIGPPS